MLKDPKVRFFVGIWVVFALCIVAVIIAVAVLGPQLGALAPDGSPLEPILGMGGNVLSFFAVASLGLLGFIILAGALWAWVSGRRKR